MEYYSALKRKEFIFLLFRAAPAAYRSSQARGLIGATATICWPTAQPQQCGIHAASATYITAHGKVNPLSEAGDQTHNLVVPSRILFCCRTGTPKEGGNLNLQDSMPSEVSSHKRTSVLQFRLNEVPAVLTFTEKESRVVAARACEWKKWRVKVFDGRRVSVWEDETILEVDGRDGA